MGDVGAQYIFTGDNTKTTDVPSLKLNSEFVGFIL